MARWQSALNLSLSEGLFMNKFILLLITLHIVSCGYSPWETKIDCRDYYQDNLQRLKQIEAATSGQLAFNVAVMNDLHNNLSDIKTAVERINQRDDVAFVLILGDLTNQGLAVEFEWACKALADLKVPRFYVIGNHDSISFGKDIFLENFAPFDYAFTYKDVKFIIYNDNVYEFPEAPDYAFLEKEAAIQGGETRRKTIGASHSPPDPDEHTEEEATALRQFLSNNNFNLTLHGHTTPLYVLDEFGVPHFTSYDLNGAKYSMLFVSDTDQLTLQNCAATCTDAILEN